MALSRIYRSNGEDCLRVFFACGAPRSAAPPVELEARVVLTEPRLTATAERGVVGSGPRNPDEKVWPRPKAPAVQMPDARPLNKAQHFILDPDLLAEWDGEAETK